MNLKKIAITSLGILTMLSFSFPALAANTMSKSPRTKTVVSMKKPVKRSASTKKLTPKPKPVMKAKSVIKTKLNKR